MPELPRTCVIGAGVSGLTAGKALTDWGIPYTCFESSDDVGGNWYFRNPNGRSSAYRSLHIDTSKPSISFKDFPMPDRYPDYPHHTEIVEWLRDYADAFGLRERIRFNTTVRRAERLEGRGWRIVTDRGDTELFDALAVGNGHHWDPSLPDFPGRFSGDTCTPTTTSTSPTRSTCAAGGCWWSESATAPSTSPPSCRARVWPRRCSSPPAAARG
jgi:cation diffusion facilitator CzcD-associated flavoprotein CzcO